MSIEINGPLLPQNLGFYRAGRPQEYQTSFAVMNNTNDHLRVGAETFDHLMFLCDAAAGEQSDWSGPQLGEFRRVTNPFQVDLDVRQISYNGSLLRLEWTNEANEEDYAARPQLVKLLLTINPE